MTISDNAVTMRPVIGITAYAEDASWGVWKVPAALTPLAYVTKVEAAGGRPLLVPPADDAVEETLDVLDGLVFTGGPDLDPTLYDAEPHPETTTSGRSATAPRSRCSPRLSNATCPCSPSAAARRC